MELREKGGERGEEREREKEMLKRREMSRRLEDSIFDRSNSARVSRKGVVGEV